MPHFEIARRRLQSQRLAGQAFAEPEEAVRWFGAVQAQEYPYARWALGLRTQDATDAAVAQAVDEGRILRTHAMRPTWHFVTPADIGWLLALTAPRVKAASASYCRRLELDEAIFARSNAALVQALEGGRQLTRAELRAVLEEAGIAPGDSTRMSFILMRAELDGLICSGPWRGKQATYALLDERASQAVRLERDAALAELALRYFTSHGPATLQDYRWWSGLLASDARAGVDLLGAQLDHAVIDGKSCWLPASAPAPAARAALAVPAAHLLPTYDEYTVGYTDRSAIFDGAHADKLDEREGALLGNVIVVQGEVVGAWKRTLAKGEATVEARLFRPLTDAESQALAAAAERYGRFHGLPARLVWG